MKAQGRLRSVVALVVFVLGGEVIGLFGGAWRVRRERVGGGVGSSLDGLDGLDGKAAGDLDETGFGVMVVDFAG